MVPAVCGGVLQVSGLGKLGSALLGEEPLGDAQWNPTPSTSLSAGSSAKGGLGWGTHEFSVVNQAVTLTTGSMSEMGMFQQQPARRLRQIMPIIGSRQSRLECHFA